MLVLKRRSTNKPQLTELDKQTATPSDPQKDTENKEIPPPFCRECMSTSEAYAKSIHNPKQNKLGYLHLQVGGFHIKALVDTGASVSVMSQELANQIWVCDPDSIIWRSNPKPDTTITLADGKKVPVLEKMQLQMQIFDEDVQETFHILQETHTTILGWPFFANNDLTIDCKRRLLIRENCTFQINSIEITRASNLTSNKATSAPSAGHYSASRTTRIPLLQTQRARPEIQAGNRSCRTKQHTKGHQRNG